MWFMVSMNPSPIISPHQSAAFGKEGTPFSQTMVSLTKQEYIQLKWDGRYWRRQHDRAVAREATLKQELERGQARIRDLEQRLYGKRSEKGATASEAQPGGEKPSRPRGQAPGSQGHGRTLRPCLPVIKEWRALPPEGQVCPCCQAPFDPFPGAEDSTVVEIHVGAYVRKIKRLRYRKTCQCPQVPGLITAPPAPRLLPKSSLGVSVWVEVLLRKYLHAIPTNRLCADLNNLGVPMALGTLTGGLKKLAPLFGPLQAALLERHLAERLFHGDETRWKVFQEVAGKVGYRWYLWLTRSASVVYFWMAPGRGADVLKQHMAGLDKDAPVIFVCDRYSAYPCWAKDYPMVLLAFCWAHVRRDFLDGAKAWPELATWMHAWVEAIGELYHLNAQRLAVWDEASPLAGQSPPFQARHQALANRLAEMATRRDLGLAGASLHSAQKKVLNSLKNHWAGLTVFVDHPHTPMDNNKAENSLRNPATGRKNYYGSGAIWSAELAAMLFSVLQTAILWGLNPRHWLHAFLTACAENGGQPLTDLTPFLPWTIDEARRNALKQPLKLPFPEMPVDVPPDTS
jgi:transposase